MKTIHLLLAACVAMLVTSCTKNDKTQTDPIFDYSPAVDLSSVLEAYDWYQKEGGQSEDDIYDLQNRLMSTPDSEVWLCTDTSFIVHLPQYANAKHPFLPFAEDFYNGMVYGWNVWSNVEVWFRSMTSSELFDEDEVKESVKSISIDFLHDTDILQAAERYRNVLLKSFDDLPKVWEDEPPYMPYALLNEYLEAIDNKTYKFYEDPETFADSLDSVIQKVEALALERFRSYEQAKGDEQLKVMLDLLANASNFDEQCSLWRNWSNSMQSSTENVWVLAVAEKLMNSGYYSPILNKIWFTFRALTQTEYYGASRDSEIPNHFYNDFRRKCYVSCLDRIQRHPDDRCAMACAYSIAGRVNLNRFGQYMMGNEAVPEIISLLPNRYNYAHDTEDAPDPE